MTTNEVYEHKLLEQLAELDRTRDFVESELREVRNRIDRDKNSNVIDWSTGKPRFNDIGGWVKDE